MQRRGELQKSKQSLETANILLNTALANMANGLCMFDRDQRLIVCNERYAEMYSLDRGTYPARARRFDRILELRIARQTL